MNRIRTWRRIFVPCLLISTISTPCLAGMPAPLQKILTIHESFSLSYWTTDRLQAISFFLFAVLLSAWFIKLLWNTLQRDWPNLPKLRYRSALAATLLWGLLFVVVLTMIAGARELMTPGAWVQDGYTYRLAHTAPKDKSPDFVEARKLHLERLSVLLMRQALANDGRYPNALTEIKDPKARVIPGWYGQEYFYVPGLSMKEGPELLAFEPEFDGVQRYCLFSDGSVKQLTTQEINKRLVAMNSDSGESK